MRPAPDAEIAAARRAAERHRQATLTRRERAAALRRKEDGLQERKRRAEAELASLTLFGRRRRRELYPDAAMAPAPELWETWPKDVLALEACRADHEFRDQGLAGHIDMAEGRFAEPAPGPMKESEPEPEKPRDNGPSLDF